MRFADFFRKKKNIHLPDHAIASVVSGNLMPLEHVSDPVFSQKMLGNGVAVIPNSNCIVAPCKGTIQLLYPTLHAVGLTTEDGVELLIHIGIDTVSLGGKGFRAYVHQGDKVEPGDRLLEIDSNFIKKQGYDLTIMTIFTNEDCYQLKVSTDGYVTGGSTIVATYEIK